jgi:asparagine synthetase B (glutamine-hydrolysing)
MRTVTGVVDRFEFTHRKGDPSLYAFYNPEVEKTFKASFEAGRGGDDDLETMLRFDRRYFLQGLLNIDDKMSGRHSVESRPSLLHQRLVRHLLEVDTRALLSNGSLKPVLRQVAAGLVPKTVAQRNDKLGFTTPIGTFVNKASHLIRERITDSRFRHLYDLRRRISPPRPSSARGVRHARSTFGLIATRAVVRACHLPDSMVRSRTR